MIQIWPNGLCPWLFPYTGRLLYNIHVEGTLQHHRGFAFSTMFVLDIVASFLLLWVIRLYTKKKWSRLPLPPGPKRLPFVGNLFNMPRSLEWEVYDKWSKDLSKHAKILIFICSLCATFEDRHGYSLHQCCRHPSYYSRVVSCSCWTPWTKIDHIFWQVGPHRQFIRF